MTFLGFIGLSFAALVAYGIGCEVVRVIDDRDRRRHIEVCARIEAEHPPKVRRSDELKRQARALRDLRALEAREAVELERLFNLPSRTPFHEETP